MTTIAKTFTFDAAHRLTGLPADHKCHRMHGHTYEVELVLRGPVDSATGMIVDYADIAAAWHEVAHDVLDHRYLNDIPGLEVPTTEVLALWLLRRLDVDHRLNLFGFRRQGPGRADFEVPLLERVRVKESSTTWCEVTRADL